MYLNDVLQPESQTTPAIDAGSRVIFIDRSGIEDNVEWVNPRVSLSHSPARNLPYSAFIFPIASCFSDMPYTWQVIQCTSIDISRKATPSGPSTLCTESATNQRQLLTKRRRRVKYFNAPHVEYRISGLFAKLLPFQQFNFTSTSASLNDEMCIVRTTHTYLRSIG